MKNIQTAMYTQVLYMLGLGFSFLFFPNFILPLFGMSTTTEVWARIVGLLAIVFGTYYYILTKNKVASFYWASVYGRYVFCAGLAVLTLVGIGEKPLYLFALLESGLAIWAHFALLRTKTLN